MAVLTKTRRFRVAAEFSYPDGDGVRHLTAGDELPADWAADHKAELEIGIGHGLFHEIGAKPAPRPAPEPPRSLTPVEILRRTFWPRARVDAGHVIDGPRGTVIKIVDKVGDSDLKRLGGGSPFDTQILVHPAPDGGWVATVHFAKLASLLAGRGVG